MLGILKALRLPLILSLINSSCATRYENNCPAPVEYRKKSIVTILKEAREIVSQTGEKRAVVFGLYGNKKHYTQGMLENIEMAKEFYPTWDVVIFMDSKTVPSDLITEAKSKGAVVKVSPEYGNASARFFILDFLEYDRFIVRDVDSRIQPREVAAVADWIKNDWAILHGMHDSKLHLDPLLGGMWGAKSKQLRQKLIAAFKNPSMQKLYQQFIGQRKAVYGDDQKFLEDYIMKAVGYDALLEHESFLCHEYPHSCGFPIPRGSAAVHIGGVKGVD